MIMTQPRAESSATRVRRLVVIAGLAGAGHWMIYVAEKIYLAAIGTVGMIGSPASPAAAAAVADPAAAQLGNAAFGLLPALVSLVAILPLGRRVPRPLLLTALCLVLAATLALVALLLTHANWAHLVLSAAGLVAIVSLTAASFLRLPGTAHST
ncbi:hypothetical protein [Microlunatus speluncae]|uniref:hypothetical protein n=1 Tax=Microlunatus speluncae TaxID=2594267 RepID=UPI00126643BD|nr:hypothetical protein [Microlunatus speluncae]